jgi:hypothetical protein
VAGGLRALQLPACGGHAYAAHKTEGPRAAKAQQLGCFSLRRGPCALRHDELSLACEGPPCNGVAYAVT